MLLLIKRACGPPLDPEAPGERYVGPEAPYLLILRHCAKSTQVDDAG